MEPGSGKGARARCADLTTVDLAPCPQDAATPHLIVGATAVPLVASPGATTA